MKGLLASALFVAVLTLGPAPARALATDREALSLGFVLGDPTGFTLRNGLGQGDALQLHLGFGHWHGRGLGLNVDWTHDMVDLVRGGRDLALLFYLGVGGEVEWFRGGYRDYDWRYDRDGDGHLGIGVRGLLGLRASFRPPFDIFLELAPIGILFDVAAPAAYYDVDVALGVRFRF